MTEIVVRQVGVYQAANAQFYVFDLSFLTLWNILLWTGAWSVIGFLLMGEDKSLARNQAESRHPHRISERTLHEVALIGGFLGIILGARIFRHKTAKLIFWWPIVVATILWLTLLGAIETGAIPL